jgi:sugar phosphate isomerase/epimerase
VRGVLVGLSTSATYPESAASSFATASELGYDGVEVMVWTDPLTRDAAALKDLSERHGCPVLSIHAPTLLLTQRVWGRDAWGKVERSVELARGVGASTVVLHPPFRWQRAYAEGFVEGVARLEADSGVTLAVENMFPWHVRGREVAAYAPTWDPTHQSYSNLTLDVSHAATAFQDSLELARTYGSRLAHLHLTDGTSTRWAGTVKDEHLVPGDGTQPVAEVLELLAASRAAGTFTGHVVAEVNTRKLDPLARRDALARTLTFARTHLQVPATSG